MKFICDDNLGRLARWLRTLGYDTAFDRNITDERLIAVSLAEDRTIVTRDRRLAQQVLARNIVLLRENNPLRQVQELLTLTGLRGDPARLFSRCVVCNTEVEPIDKEKFVEVIPPYVWRTHERFHRCRSCGRIFWDGTHTRRLRELLDSIGIGKK